jgi:hypothetical protein
MLSTPKEAASYTINTIKEIAPLENHNLDEDILEWVIEDLLYEKLTQLLSEQDIETIQQHNESDEYFREYCQIHIPKYYTLLEDITKELITDYLIEEKELHEPTDNLKNNDIVF